MPNYAPFESPISSGTKKPPFGGSSGGADRNRTDGYRICSPGPYHLATAPCVDAMTFYTIRAAFAARAVERVMGFEPTTSTLARLHSTTELHPRERPRLAMAGHSVNGQFHGPPPVGRPPGRPLAGGPPLLLRSHGTFLWAALRAGLWPVVLRSCCGLTAPPVCRPPCGRLHRGRTAGADDA